MGSSQSCGWSGKSGVLLLICVVTSIAALTLGWAQDHSALPTEQEPLVSMEAIGVVEPFEHDSLDSLVGAIKDCVEDKRKQGNSESADDLEERLEKALENLREGFRGQVGSRLELHVVGHYEGRSFGRLHREAHVRITHCSAPIILCLTSYEPIQWHVEVAPDAELRQVILGGREQLVSGLSDDVPVADYSRPRVTRKGITHAYRRKPSSGSSTNSVGVLSKQLKELTGLPISTFQGAYQAPKTPWVVGPESKSWREQRAINALRRVLLQATREDRSEWTEELSRLRFSAIHYPRTAQDRSRRFAGPASLGFGPHTVFGPLLGELEYITVQQQLRELDPRGVCRPDESFALVNPATGRRDVLPWKATSSLPPISHICAFAYDSKRDRWIVIGQTEAGFQMFAVTVADQEWSIIRSVDKIDLHTLCYSQEDDAYYGLAYRFDYRDGLALYKFHPDGAILAKGIVPGLKGRFGPDHRPWLQLISTSEYLVAIIIRHGTVGQPLDQGDVYSNVIDPDSRRLVFTTPILPADDVERQRELYADLVDRNRRPPQGHLAMLPEVKTETRAKMPEVMEAVSPLLNPSNNHHYELVRVDNVNWKQAVALASRWRFKGTHGYLVTITSPQENELLSLNFGESGATWAGASDEDREGVWKWTVGPEAGTVFYRHYSEAKKDTGYSNWGENDHFREPNNSGDGEHYLLWNWDSDPRRSVAGKWNDWDADRDVDHIIVEYSK
jgi:hypothetical protein